MSNQITLTDLSVEARTKLYYDLFIPEQSAQNAPLMIAVHGYGAHKRYMMREARLIAPDDFVIASVQAPHQHFRQTDNGFKVGFGWLTDYKSEESVAVHHQFLLDLIDNLAHQNLIDTEKIYLYGFSQACALNFRFALTFPDILRGVLAVCGGIPGDLETSGLYQAFAAETFYLYGDTDEFYTLEKFQGYERKLKEKLPNFRSKLYHAKHEITEEMRRDLRAWIKEKP